MNGIAFQDQDEIWWMETIGGHHWIAKKVPDDVYVVMPNQFGTDVFDMKDALTDQNAHMCSKDLAEFIEKEHLDLTIRRSTECKTEDADLPFGRFINQERYLAAMMIRIMSTIRQEHGLWSGT